MKRTVLTSLGIILCLLSSPQSQAQQAFQETYTAHEWLTTANNDSILHTGSAGNQRAWETLEDREIPAGASLIDHQRSGRDQLVIYHLAGDPQLRFLLNGVSIAENEGDISEAKLAGNQLFGIRISDENINGQLAFYDRDEDRFQDLKTRHDGTVQNLRATVNGSDIRLLWTERTSTIFLLKSCVVQGNACRSRVIREQALSSPYLETLLSKNEVVMVTQSGNQVRLTACYLSGAGAFLNGSTDNYCDGDRIIDTEKTPQETKQFSFEKPFLSWSQREQGIFEIALSDVSADNPRTEMVTTQSAGDQLRVSINRFDSDTPLLVWEDYSNGQLLNSMALKKSEELFQWRTDNTLKAPRLVIFSNNASCEERIEISGQLDGAASVRTTQKILTETSITSPLLRFEVPRERVSLIIDGELTEESEILWRAKPTQEWRVTTLKLTAEGWTSTIEQAIPSLQIQLLFNDSAPQCFQNISIEQEGRIVEVLEDAEGEVIPIETDFDPTLSTLQDAVSSELSETELSRDQFEQLKNLEEGSGTLRIVNIQPRSTLSVLDIISGTAPDANKPIWFHLIDQQRNSTLLGRTLVASTGVFSFTAPEASQRITGEVTLVATQIPDIRLASLYPDKISAFPIYLYNEQDLAEQKTVIDLAIDLENLIFRQDSELQALQSEDLKVYANSSIDRLTISLQGRLFGENLDGIILKTVHLPSGTESSSPLADQQQGTFELSETFTNLSFGEKQQIILYAINPEQVQSTSHAVSFVLYPINELPSFLSISKKLLSEQVNLVILLITLLIVSVILLAIYRKKPPFRWIILLIILGAWTGLTVIISRAVLTEALQEGLISHPNQEITVQQKSRAKDPRFTLTKLNENLDVTPGLASHWTTISPTTWEFKLRYIESDDVIRSIRRKIEDRSGQQQAIASVIQLVKIGPETLQFVTRYPDPLLPAKLSRLSIDVIEESNEITILSEPYRVIEQASYQERQAKNYQYSRWPFLSWTPPFRSIFLIRNEEAIAESITTGRIDLYQDPDTQHWERLEENDYNILPRVNTESILLLTDRQSFILKNQLIIEGLREIVQNPELIPKGSENYAKIATQIAPPGVLGYTPDLEMNSSDTSAVEKLAQGMAELELSEITLSLSFPSSQYELARSLESILQDAGVNIIPNEITTNAFEAALLEGLSDLIILPLSFDLADIGPFLDNIVDSSSPFNHSYQNEETDQLIQQARTELSTYKRLQLLQQIVQIITYDDPIGIPLLYPQSYEAVKKAPEQSWQERLLAWLIW